jgi:hypothetical protein
MKQVLTLIGICLFFSAAAQTGEEDDLSVIQSMYGKEKHDLVQEYMQFNDSASAHAFWKIYNSYETERKKLGEDYLTILQDYVDHYENINDKKADELITKTSANNIAMENLYVKYYKKLKPAIGALKASQFIQLEAYLHTAIKIYILDGIPFIGDIDKSKKPAAN